MDVLNFISWLKSKRQVTTVDASQTLIPLGLKDARRDDGYLPAAISVDDLLALSPGLPSFIEYNETNKTVWNNGINNNPSNTSFGENALTGNPGSYCTAIGNYALRIGIGDSNTAIGGYAIGNLINGSNNVAVGAFALAGDLNNNNNTAIGYSCLPSNTTGQSNTAVGSEALLNNTTGIYNTFVGISAGTGITVGSGNVGLGWRTLSGGPNGTGQNNIGIGQLAGENVGAANFSIAIGSGTQINGYSNSIILGQNAAATASNQLVIGSQFPGENIGTIATEALIPTISWTVRINGVNYKIPLQIA